MEKPPDFFEVLDKVIDKSIKVAEKAIKDREPSMTSWLQSMESWLDNKLENPSHPK